MLISSKKSNIISNLLYIFLILTFVLQSLSIAYAAGPAKALSADVTDISSTSVKFTGIVSPNGAETQAWFEYGTSETSLSLLTNAQSINSNLNNNANILQSEVGLRGDTDYFFRVCATNQHNGNEPSCASTAQFRTPVDLNPSVILKDANGNPINTGDYSKNTKTNYELLAPLPDGTKTGFIEFETDPSKNPCALGKYLNIAFKIFIGICAVLAMLMIIIGGLEYMTSELVSSKESGKSKALNAVLGLIIAFSAYIILYTINPQLLDICLNNLPVATVTVDPEDISTEATTLDGKTKVGYNWYKTFNNENACPGKKGEESNTCVKLETTNLPKKSSNKYLEKDTLNKLISFDAIMKSSGISWYITEAFPPTFAGHSSKCHSDGTCLDLNLENASPEKIKIIIDGLISQGMCPNYEVTPGGITKNQLNSAGIPDSRIWNGKGTGPHIHVVNANCK